MKFSTLTRYITFACLLLGVTHPAGAEVEVSQILKELSTSQLAAVAAYEEATGMTVTDPDMLTEIAEDETGLELLSDLINGPQTAGCSVQNNQCVNDGSCRTACIFATITHECICSAEQGLSCYVSSPPSGGQACVRGSCPSGKECRFHAGDGSIFDPARCGCETPPTPRPAPVPTVVPTPGGGGATTRPGNPVRPLPPPSTPKPTTPLPVDPGVVIKLLRFLPWLN